MPKKEEKPLTMKDLANAVRKLPDEELWMIYQLAIERLRETISGLQKKVQEELEKAKK